MKAIKLKCDSFKQPIQIERKEPELSWEFEAVKGGCNQSAYEIIVVQRKAGRESQIVWDSGKVPDSQSTHIKYQGKELLPNTRYEWKVGIWDGIHEEPVWSMETFFETGLMQEEWCVEWIGYDVLQDGESAFDRTKPFYCADDFEKGENEYYLPPLPYLRKEFKLPEFKEIQYAKLYVSAFGLAEVSINGRDITQERFVPGFSDYNRTVYARAYDVSGRLYADNAIGVLLADGWYAGYVGLNNRQWYGDKPRVMVQLHITYKDGKEEVIGTDRSWKACFGAVEYGDILQGEAYNAQKEMSGWNCPHYDDSLWQPVETGAEHSLLPIGHQGPPVVERQILGSIQMKKESESQYLLDFGKNISGTIILHVKGKCGSKIIIRYAEILDSAGNLYLRGNRSAQSMDIYILKGEGTEVFKPKFTYHGFRYAQVSIPKEVEIIKAEAVSMGSKIERTTLFESSNPIVNDIFTMVQNTRDANLFEVPTDCNARDERIGWGMEGNHFLGAMTYLSDLESFIKKWVKDIWDGQRENGALEAVAPPMMMKDIEQFVGDLQSNHGVHMVYTLFKMYGNLHVVEEYYDRMQKYFSFLEHNADRYIRIATSADWLGIWESTGHSDTEHGYGDCFPEIIGTTHYGIVTKMMIEMSAAIHRWEETEKYQRLYHDIKKAFGLNFVQRNGFLRRGHQGDYVMALAAGFLDKEESLKAIDWLERELRKDGSVFWKGGTPSTPYFLDVLKEYGKEELANDFLTSQTYPSIGYMRKKGSWTLWERWDGIYEDDTIHPQVMNAMNHIGFSVIAKYLVTGLAGIAPLEPGFKKFLICPGITEKVNSVHCIYRSGYGKIEVDCKLLGQSFKLQCSIPCNTKAKIEIPCKTGGALMVNGKEMSAAVIREGKVSVELPAGRYQIETQTGTT